MGLELIDVKKWTKWMEAIQIYVKAEVPCVEGYNGGD